MGDAARRRLAVIWLRVPPSRFAHNVPLFHPDCPSFSPILPLFFTHTARLFHPYCPSFSPILQAHFEQLRAQHLAQQEQERTLHSQVSACPVP